MIDRIELYITGEDEKACLEDWARYRNDVFNMGTNWSNMNPEWSDGENQVTGEPLKILKVTLYWQPT